MNAMKRLGRTALVLTLVALVAASPALAARKQAKPVSHTYELVAPATNPPEPGASGQCTLTVFPDLPLAGPWVEVSCRRLTPETPYDVVVLVEQWVPSYVSYCQRHSVSTDRRGRLECEFGDSLSLVVDLWIENDGGSVVLQMER